MHIELRKTPLGNLEYRVAGGFNTVSNKWKEIVSAEQIYKLAEDTGMKIVSVQYKPPRKRPVR